MACFQLKGLSPHAQGYSSNDSSSVTNSFHWTATNTEIYSSHLTSTSNYQPIFLFACKVLKNSHAHLLCINCTWAATMLFTSGIFVPDMHSTSSYHHIQQTTKEYKPVYSVFGKSPISVPIFSSECRKRGLLQFCFKMQKLIGLFQPHFRLSQLHQCDWNKFSWKFIEELLL